jgi:hypothetical protein
VGALDEAVLRPESSPSAVFRHLEVRVIPVDVFTLEPRSSGTILSSARKARLDPRD